MTMSAEILEISDPGSGARAQVLPALGMNCFGWQVPFRGRWIDVLWSEDAFAGGRCRPSGSGIPILFPFPGRIRGTSFRWCGADYPLVAGDGQGNAIHGFVHERPWRVVEHEVHRVIGQFQASHDDPDLLRRWPADFRITATYEIGTDSLLATYVVENPDDVPLPWGLGTHPYYALPLGGPSAEVCQIKLPVRAGWELNDLVATGRKQPLSDAAQYLAGRPFDELQLDNVFGDLVTQDGQCRAELCDPVSACRLTMSFGSPFRECVVYTPSHRQAICIEPYTCVPGAIELQQHGIDAGLQQLAPSDSVEATVRISLSSDAVDG